MVKEVVLVFGSSVCIGAALSLHSVRLVPLSTVSFVDCTQRLGMLGGPNKTALSRVCIAIL